jgi:uncharacterized protein YeeX (DUF496 family)
VLKKQKQNKKQIEFLNLHIDFLSITRPKLNTELSNLIMTVKVGYGDHVANFVLLWNNHYQVHIRAISKYWKA